MGLTVAGALAVTACTAQGAAPGGGTEVVATADAEPVVDASSPTPTPGAPAATPGPLLLTEEQLRAVLGPGRLAVRPDETLNRAGLPPTCDHYEWDDHTTPAVSIQVHMVTPLENRLPYETVTISDYTFAGAEDATEVMERRRREFQDCTAFAQRGLELQAEELVDLDVADEAFLHTATASTASAGSVTGVGGEDSSQGLEEPARVCWIQVRVDDRVAVVGAFGAQALASVAACSELAAALADALR